MKIDESCINDTVVSLIKNTEPWEFCEESGRDSNARKMTLGYISGAVDLAEELKKVLKKKEGE